MIRFLSEHKQVTVGKYYRLEDIVNTFTEAVMHRIYEKLDRKEDVINEISHLIQMEPWAFNIRDPRSLQYPLLKMVRTRTFQSIWLEKYPEKTISKETEEKIYNGHHSYSYTNERKTQYGTPTGSRTTQSRTTQARTTQPRTTQSRTTFPRMRHNHECNII